jgi:hypothetical protein
VSGDGYVRGEIETKISPEVAKKRDATEKESRTKDSIRLVLEILGVALVAIYAGLTLWLARSSQKSADAATTASNSAVASYETTVRPYLSMAGITAKVDPKPVNLTFNAILKNYGTIPAQAVTYSWVVIVNGSPVPVSHVPDQPHALPPGETNILVGALGTAHAPPIVDGSQPLLIYTAYSYHWRDKQESGCEKFRYYPPAKGFFDLGPTCYPN